MKLNKGGGVGLAQPNLDGRTEGELLLMLAVLDPHQRIRCSRLAAQGQAPRGSKRCAMRRGDASPDGSRDFLCGCCKTYKVHLGTNEVVVSSELLSLSLACSRICEPPT